MYLPPRALQRDFTTQSCKAYPTIEGFYDCLQNSCLVDAFGIEHDSISALDCVAMSAHSTTRGSGGRSRTR
jgi:hypothetical protein